MKLETLNCPSCGAPLEIHPKPYQQFTCPACQSTLMLTDFDQRGAVVCESCGTANDPTALFCAHCNAALQAGCPYCYQMNPVDTLRCAKCGIDLQRAWAQQRSWLDRKNTYDSERREATRQAILNGRRAEIRRLLIQLDEPENHPLAVYCLQQYGEEAVEGLIGALSSNDPDARYGAAHTLGLIGDRRAVPALIAALADPEPAVRFWAADALGRMHASQAAPALAKLKKDKVKAVREKVESVLESLGNDG